MTIGGRSGNWTTSGSFGPLPGVLLMRLGTLLGARECVGERGAAMERDRDLGCHVDDAEEGEYPEEREVL
jgi:hypothetical protein